MERLKQLGAEGLVFLRALVWPVTSSVRDNVGLASLSIVLGFALWIFVTDTENPTRSGTLPFDLPVEAVNVPGDLAPAGSPGDARVEGGGGGAADGLGQPAGDAGDPGHAPGGAEEPVQQVGLSVREPGGDA